VSVQYKGMDMRLFEYWNRGFESIKIMDFHLLCCVGSDYLERNTHTPGVCACVQ
jgi:hypothetical protein